MIDAMKYDSMIPIYCAYGTSVQPSPYFLPHNAVLAQYMLWACVHLPVCSSVTSRSSVEMAKHSMM